MLGFRASAGKWAGFTLAANPVRDGNDRPLRPLTVEARATLIGAGVGLLAWFLPDLIGGRDSITYPLPYDIPMDVIVTEEAIVQTIDELMLGYAVAFPQRGTCRISGIRTDPSARRSSAFLLLSSHLLS
jgi:hypothetical protein